MHGNVHCALNFITVLKTFNPHTHGIHNDCNTAYKVYIKVYKVQVQKHSVQSSESNHTVSLHSPAMSSKCLLSASI